MCTDGGGGAAAAIPAGEGPNERHQQWVKAAPRSPAEPRTVAPHAGRLPGGRWLRDPRVRKYLSEPKHQARGEDSTGGGDFPFSRRTGRTLGHASGMFREAFQQQSSFASGRFGTFGGVPGTGIASRSAAKQKSDGKTTKSPTSRSQSGAIGRFRRSRMKTPQTRL